MKSESTISKGTRLENQVYELLLKLLRNDNFIVPGKTSKIYKKKGYPSQKRQKEIVFDITIETTIANADKYSLLTIIECKNVGKPIIVDDIEEFGSKINQVGEHNTKGIFITTSTFQESALNIARAEGIGLIRIISDNELQWINYRKSSRSITNIDNEQTNKLINVDFNSEPFICSINNNTITNFADLLLELSIIDVFNDNEEYINIPFITHNRFNEIVNKLIEKNVYDGVTLNIDKIVQFLEPIYGLKFEFDTVENDNYLGKIEFEPLRVKISNKARIDKNMWRFTVAHEIGHLILHSPILKERIKEKSDDEKSLTFRFSETNNNRDKIEIQANLFASYLLMPEIKLLQIIQSIFKKYNIHKNYLYLDSQPVNQKEVYEILYNLSEIFQVSVAVVKIRLIKLKLLEDKTDYKLSTIMRNYRL